MHITEIDFDVVRRCDDMTKLKLMANLLESEPYYPDLLACVRSRMNEISPGAAQHIGDGDISGLARPSAEERNSIDQWATDMTALDQSIKLDDVVSSSITTGIRGKPEKGQPSKIDPFSLPVYIQEHTAEHYKGIGNEYFRSADYSTAIIHYSKCIEQSPPGSRLTAVAIFNRANCHFHLKLWRKTEKDATSAIEIHPTYVKALFLRGKSRQLLQKLELALADLEYAHELDPENVSIEQKLTELRTLTQPVIDSRSPISRQKMYTEEVPPKKRYNRLTIIEEEVEGDEEDSDNHVGNDHETLDARSNITIDQFIDHIEELKSDGTLAFSKGNFDEAVMKYSDAIKICETKLNSDKDTGNINKLWSSLLANRGLVFANQSLPDLAERDYSRVLSSRKSSDSDEYQISDSLVAKLLMRRGLIYESLDKLDLAIGDFRQVRSLYPDARQHLNRLIKARGKTHIFDIDCCTSLLPHEKAYPPSKLAKNDIAIPRQPVSVYDFQNAVLALKGAASNSLYCWIRQISIPKLCTFLREAFFEGAMLEEIIEAFAQYYVKEHPGDCLTLMKALASSSRLSLSLMFLDQAGKQGILDIFAYLERDYPESLSIKGIFTK